MTESDATPHDPGHPDPEAMDSRTYHTVVGPALQAAADVAAKRGHPTLHDDMPAMLALVEMVTRLVDLFREHYPDHSVSPEILDGAATGACVMVFQQAKLSPEATRQCVTALETAYRQAHEQAVIDSARPFVAMAWSHLEDDERDEAKHCLEQASQNVIAEIENWQQAQESQ